jgi:chitinase
MSKNGKMMKSPKSVTITEQDACYDGRNDDTRTFYWPVKAYWTEWSPYNVEEPTGIPGSTNKTPCDNNIPGFEPPHCPGSTHDRWDLYNENTKNLEDKLEYVDTLVYSFVEIKQNTNPNIVADSGGLMNETSTSYTSNAQDVGKIYIFDPWSALCAVKSDGTASSDALWFAHNNDLISQGLIDSILTQGIDTTIWSDITGGLGYGNLSALRQYTWDHPYNFKTQLGIGGYGDVYQDGWLAAINNPERFAKSVAKVVSSFNFEGVDLDWEPLSFINHDPNLQTPLQDQFINMVQILRETLGKDKLISFPIGVNIKDIEDFGIDNWESLMKYVDEIGLMAYDMHGTFDNPKLTGLHSMTYPIGCDTSQLSADSAVQKLIEMGVSSQKILVGYPSYGRGLEGACEGKLGAEFTDPHIGANLDPATGISSYKWLMNKLDTDPNAKEYTVIVDHDGKPFANGAYMYFDNDVFYSYDNVASLTDKAHYIVNNDLRGALTWLIENDLPVSDERSLIKVIADIMHNAEKDAVPVRYTKLLPDLDFMEMTNNHNNHMEGKVLLVA